MNKQELIKKYEDLFEKLYAFPIVTINGVIEDFKQLDEPQKVMIPRFIADWIVQAKEDGYNIAGAINEAPRGAVDDWLELENVDIFAEAWINGYTIEKEKRYTVKMKGMDKKFMMFKLVVEGEVKQWAKYDRQDSIRVTFENGEEYYTHSSNVILYNK